MNFARFPAEQNVEVFLFEGSFYFRTICKVGPGEELLIWPSERLSAKLKIPKRIMLSNNKRKTYFYSQKGFWYECSRKFLLWSTRDMLQIKELLQIK